MPVRAVRAAADFQRERAEKERERNETGKHTEHRAARKRRGRGEGCSRAEQR